MVSVWPNACQLLQEVLFTQTLSVAQYSGHATRAFTTKRARCLRARFVPQARKNSVEYLCWHRIGDPVLRRSTDSLYGRRTLVRSSLSDYIQGALCGRSTLFSPENSDFCDLSNDVCICSAIAAQFCSNSRKITDFNNVCQHFTFYYGVLQPPNLL